MSYTLPFLHCEAKTYLVLQMMPTKNQFNTIHCTHHQHRNIQAQSQISSKLQIRLQLFRQGLQGEMAGRTMLQYSKP